MRHLEKLLETVAGGVNYGVELVSLLGKKNWQRVRQKGSHQSWSDGENILIIIAECRDLKPYRIKEAQKAIFVGEK